MFSTTTAIAQKYLFYLHGKIIEDQGANAVDNVNGFGTYQYQDILNTFSNAKFTVLSEVRQKNTDAAAYAHKIVSQIDSLLKTGAQPSNITVVGASKGAIIAMLVSLFLKNKDVNFVFMAGCNQSVRQQFPAIKFCGNILSIYETSDDIGHSCLAFKNQDSSSISHYKEIALTTGLKHGFLYKPLPQWINPAVQWANGRY